MIALRNALLAAMQTVYAERRGIQPRWISNCTTTEPDAPCSVLYTSRLKSLPWISSGRTSEVVSFSETESKELFHATLDQDFGTDEVTQHSQALLDFAGRVEKLPIAVAVGANLLREKTASPLAEGALDLRMAELTDGIKDVPGLFQKAINSQPEREQKLLAACAACVQAGFWLPLARDISELDESDAKKAPNAW